MDEDVDPKLTDILGMKCCFSRQLHTRQQRETLGQVRQTLCKKGALNELSKVLCLLMKILIFIIVIIIIIP